MSIIQATQAEIAAIWPTLNAGDTLQLSGEFVDWRPGKRTFDKRLVVDASQAVVRGLYGGTLNGVDWHGGIIKAGDARTIGFRIDHADNFSISGVTLDDDKLTGNGLQFYMGSNVVIDGVTGKGFLDAIVLARIDGFAVRNFDLSGMAADCVDLYNVANGVCEDGKVGDRNPASAKHPDAVQLANLGNDGYLCTENVTVQRIAVNAPNMQGVTAFYHSDITVPNQRYKNITFRDLDIEVGYPQACALYGCDGGLVENVSVRTSAGATYMAMIHVGDGCTNVERYNNTAESYAGKPAVSDPPRSAPIRAPAAILGDLVANASAGAALMAELQASIGAQP